MLKYVAKTNFVLGAQATTEMRSIAGLLYVSLNINYIIYMYSL